MTAAITVTPTNPSTAIVAASASGPLIRILSLPKAMLASGIAPPAAAIHRPASTAYSRK